MTVRLEPGALRAAREARDLSRREVADRVLARHGYIVGGKLIERAERLDRIGDHEDLRRIVDVLGIGVSDVLPLPAVQRTLDAYGFGPEPPPPSPPAEAGAVAAEVLRELERCRAWCVHASPAGQLVVAAVLAAAIRAERRGEALLWVDCRRGELADLQVEIAGALGFAGDLVGMSPRGFARSFVYRLWSGRPDLVVMLLDVPDAATLAGFLPTHRAVPAVVFTAADAVVAELPGCSTRLATAPSPSPAAPGELPAAFAVFGQDRFSLRWAAAATGRPRAETRASVAALVERGLAAWLGAPPWTVDDEDLRLAPAARGALREPAAPGAAMSRLVAACAEEAERLREQPPPVREQAFARYGALWRGLLNHMAGRVEVALGLAQIVEGPPEGLAPLLAGARSALAPEDAARALPRVLAACR